MSYEDMEKPKPAIGEVLVKIAASSVNPIDWKLRSGHLHSLFPLNFPAILGRDLAGEIVELGYGVTGFSLGQRVMALTNRAYAEYAVVNANDLAVIPEGMGFEQAAALPLVVLTGAQLVELGVRLKAGQSLIVTGAMGGVGRSAVFVAYQHKIQVIAAVRERQMAGAESLGTLGLVALEDEAGLARFEEIDGLADTVGGAVAAGLLKRLRHGGAFASVVGIPKEVKDYDVHAEMVMVKPDAKRLGELAVAVAAGKFKIPVAQTLRLEEIREAQRLGEAGGVGGKIVLVP